MKINLQRIFSLMIAYGLMQCAFGQVTDTGDKVGIGVGSPAYKLDVAGDINLSSGSSIRVGGSKVIDVPGTSNVHLGVDAGSVSTGSYNVFLGDDAGENNSTGSYNMFLGYRSGRFNTTGSRNLKMGYGAGLNGTTGDDNTFLGQFAGALSTTSSDNVFIGSRAGYSNTTGTRNTAIGKDAGRNITTSDYNAFIGYRSGFGNTTGASNSFVGYAAGINSTSGSSNTFIGRFAGQTNTTGSSNTYLGANADGSLGLTNATAIGANANVSQDSSIVLGDNAKVGIGTSAPAYDLDVVGDINFTGTLYDNGVPFSGGVGPTGATGSTGPIGPTGIPGPTGPSSILTCTPVIVGPAGPIPVAPNTVVIVDETAGPVMLDFPSGFIGDEIVVKSIAMPFSGFPGTGITITSPIPVEDPATPGAAYPPGTTATFVGGIMKEAYKWHYCDDVYGVPVWVAILDYEPHTEGEPGPTGPTGPAGAQGPSGNTSWTVAGVNQYSAVSGNVGVGISSPGTKLHVHDPSFAFASFSTDLTGDSAFTDGFLIGTQNSGDAFIYNYENSPIKIGTKGQENMRIDTSGFVGIGTTTPSSNLQLHGSMDSELRLTNGAIGEAPGNGFSISTNQLGTARLTNFESKRVVINSSGTDGFAVEPSGDCIVFNKLGIGTIDYQDAVNVASGATKTSVRVLSYNSGDTSSLKLFEDGDYGFEFEYDGANDRLDLWSRNFSGNEARRMTWLKDGKVGIGLTPSYDLHVSTEGYIGSALYHTRTDPGDSFGVLISEGFDESSNSSIALHVGSTDDNGATQSFGVRAHMAGTSTGNKYAFYGTGAVSGTFWAGYFAGDVYSSGSYLPSDKILKTNIKDLDNANEILSKLKVHTYNYRTDKYPTMNLQNGERFGFVAEELKEVLPQLVKATEQPRDINPDGTEGPELPDIDVVNYTELIPILTAAIQEQQGQLEKLDPEKMEALETELAEVKAKNNELESKLDQILNRLESFDTDLQQCCFEHSQSGGSDNPSTGPIDESAILEQNQPNPFQENTTIKYYLPSNTMNATMAITNMDGTVLKTFNLSGKGYGQVMISGGSFPSGTYIYTLTVNGERVDSKRMMLL